jgi:hypothetical protein
MHSTILLDSPGYFLFEELNKKISDEIWRELPMIIDENVIIGIEEIIKLIK